MEIRELTKKMNALMPLVCSREHYFSYEEIDMPNEQKEEHISLDGKEIFNSTDIYLFTFSKEELRFELLRNLGELEETIKEAKKVVSKVLK
jgi:hypothetical protein